MYKEVAFDPQCLADIEYYNLVKQHFGFEKGRYISADIKAWASEAMKYVKESSLKPIRKQSVKNFLNSLWRSKKSDAFLLAPDRQGVNAACWNDWRNRQEAIRQFSCVVTESIGNRHICIDHINEGCDLWSIPQSDFVLRTPPNIVNAFFPLIILSRELILVDQYFMLASNPVLIELFNAIGRTPIRRLTVVTSMDTSKIGYTYDTEYRSLNLGPVRFGFKWIKAPDKFFHERYVISETGAMRFGQGFKADVQKGVHADRVYFNIISNEEAATTISDLDRALASKLAVVELDI